MEDLRRMVDLTKTFVSTLRYPLKCAEVDVEVLLKMRGLEKENVEKKDIEDWVAYGRGTGLGNQFLRPNFTKIEFLDPLPPPFVTPIYWMIESSLEFGTLSFYWAFFAEGPCERFLFAFSSEFTKIGPRGGFVGKYGQT